MKINLVYDMINESNTCALVLNDENTIIWINDSAEIFLRKKNYINKPFDSVFKVQKNGNGINYINIERYGKFILNEIEINRDNISKVIFLKAIHNLKDNNIKAFCYEEILNNINDGIIITDYEGKIVFFNKVQEKIENRKAEDMLGKFLWDVYAYDTEDESEHRKVFRYGEPILNKYRLLHYKNGLPRYISYNTYPMKKDNEIIGVYSISKSEENLHSLLTEVIDIKRKYINKDQNQIEKKLDNGTVYSFSDIRGSSDETKRIIKEAENIALLNRDVLIIGETGTGKEVFAQSIHNHSTKRTEPFVAVNCAAIPENLFESILFGTVKGAYTGALDTVGLFEKAKEGTLFLDELNSMPVFMQTKLLRVIQEKKVRRVGGSNVYPVFCKVISAINEEPKELMEKGLLRKDLFYRISGLTLHIPPLRERKSDTNDFIYFFINKYNRILNTSILDISDKLREKFFEYKWPGNVREFEYFMENLMIKVRKDRNELTVDDLPKHLLKEIESNKDVKGITIGNESLTSKLDDIERNIILTKLNENNWNISKTARDLKIIRQSLLYRMKRLGIKKP